MTLRFGTDGVRGVANTELTPELVLALGRAAARVLRPSRVIVGRDTRLSGPMLEAALVAGLTAEGADVIPVGVIPTPAVAWLSAGDSVTAAMISASHNPFPDNGIKFFVSGRKLDDDQEAALEAEIDRLLDAPALGGASERRTGADLGRVGDPSGEAADRYITALGATLEGRDLAGLKIVLDCANGAAFEVGPRVLRAARADVTVIHDRPDGVNINDQCGSTHPESLQRAVVEAGADAGLALDGDADRVLAVDHRGELVDGDHLLAICARDLRARERLTRDTVVVTVMSNLGLRLAMAAQGIDVIETKVGDRYVLEALESGQLSLGGEQSGHIIFRDLASTGDGLLTGLQVLDVAARSGQPLAHLAADAMTRLPQVLRNVRVGDRDRLTSAAELWAEVAAVEGELGETGRVLIRPSGTEPVVRVMVEAPSEDEAERATARLCAVVERVLG